MGGGGEGGSNGGGEKELIETVLTCEGCISDPQLPLKISRLIHHLQIITHCGMFVFCFVCFFLKGNFFGEGAKCRY